MSHSRSISSNKCMEVKAQNDQSSKPKDNQTKYLPEKFGEAINLIRDNVEILVEEYESVEKIYQSEVFKLKV